MNILRISYTKVKYYLMKGGLLMKIIEEMLIIRH